MIHIELPTDRSACGTLRVLGESGDVVFGPVPIAGGCQTPHGSYHVQLVSHENQIVLLEAHPPLAIKGQPAKYGDEVSVTSSELRLANRHLEVLLLLLDVYGHALPCRIVEGPPIAMRVVQADIIDGARDETHLRRVALARKVKSCLR